MNEKEKLLAQRMFQLEIFKREGLSFQDFFCSIMTKFDEDFTPIKPQGSVGDRKNDGFIPTKGIYYQVYSPEDPKKKIFGAIKKCKEDFTELLKYWDKKSPVKEFYFVFNEKYKGPFPEVMAEILQIQKDNPAIKISLFIAKDLENVFSNLSDEHKNSIINYIPEPDKIELIDYSALNDVVGFLLENQKPVGSSLTLNVPEFNQKIKFNNLSELVSGLLITASQQVSALDDYFSANSDFSRENIQKRLTSLYQEGLDSIQEGVVDRNDIVFFYILKGASPKETKQIQDAVLVLMSYFFETCDIFEEPK